MRNRLLSAALAVFCFSSGVAAVAQPNDSPNMVPGNQAYYWEHPEQVYRGPYDRR